MNFLQSLFIALAIAVPTPAIASTSPTIVVEQHIPTILEKIALCEGVTAHAKNPKSTASGRFQFIYDTWYREGRNLWGEDFYNKSVWSYKDNTELAVYLFSKEGTVPWNSSKSCWSSAVDG